MVRIGLPHRALVALAFLSVPAFATAQGVKTPHAPVSTAVGDITSLRSSYAEAWNNKDAKALAGFYTADATVINPDGSRVAGPAITRWFADSAATLGHVVLASRSVRIYGSTAVDVGTATLTPLSGDPQVTEYLAVLRHDVKGWRLQYLASVPKHGM